MNNIPPLDLAKQYTFIADEVNKAVLEVLASGRYIGGSTVEHFEQEFAKYIGVSHCVSCNSGTDALYLALCALEIGQGDEVITTPFTFIATSETITHTGATPVFVDIDPHTLNLDISQLEKAITPRTKAILPVHLFGQPVDMTKLMEVAQAHHLIVIEDCAQSAGARWGEGKVGSFGHVGCFSFFPTKNLGACGDGGAVTTNDPQLARSLRILKEHGQSSRYYAEKTGINSRLDALQAAILTIKLRYLDTWNVQREKVALRYQQLFAHCSEMILPPMIPGGTSVWNQYTIRLTPEKGTSKPETLLRDHVRSELQNLGIGSMVYYPIPLHLQPVYQSLGYGLGSFRVSEKIAHEVLSLPMFPELQPEQQDRVVEGVKKALTSSVEVSV